MHTVAAVLVRLLANLRRQSSDQRYYFELRILTVNYRIGAANPPTKGLLILPHNFSGHSSSPYITCPLTRTVSYWLSTDSLHPTRACLQTWHDPTHSHLIHSISHIQPLKYRWTCIRRPVALLCHQLLRSLQPLINDTFLHFLSNLRKLFLVDYPCETSRMNNIACSANCLLGNYAFKFSF